MAHVEAGDKFESFNIYSTSYKTVNDHPIAAHVLVPKNIKPGKHPLIVKFHGGCLVTGDALFQPWFASYLIPLINRTSSILVLANHRLLPEANGNDILSDLTSLWTWINSTLPSFLTSNSPIPLEPDFTRILVSGESAGGWAAIQSLLVPNPLVKGIKALHLQFPMTQVHEPLPSATVMGMPLPDPSTISEHIAATPAGTIITSAIPPVRVPLAFAMMKYGPLTAYLGSDKRFRPIDAIETLEAFPSVWVTQGREDEAVMAETNVEFVGKVEELFPGTRTRLDLESGNHGFDGEMVESEVAWLGEGLKWLEGEWLG